MDLNITKLMAEDCGQFSGSRMELGENAGEITWDNCKAESGDFIALTDEQIEEARDYFGGYGAWDDEERAAWTAHEVRALVFQELASRIRELESVAMGDDGEIDWHLAYEKSSAGQMSGVIYREGNEVFAELGE
jgi:hypothetical protein